MIAEQHRPNFFSGFEQEKNTFSNTKELLNIEWIKNFTKHNNFYRFSLDRDYSKLSNIPLHLLMAEYNDGFEWWVVAYIRDKNISALNDLPNWKPKEKILKKMHNWIRR